TGIGLQETQNMLQGYRFPHTTSSQDANRLGGGDAEGYVHQYVLIAESFGKVAKINVGRRGGTNGGGNHGFDQSEVIAHFQIYPNEAWKTPVAPTPSR